MAIILFLLSFPWSNSRLALVQKVQTPWSAPTPQERHASRRLTNAYARELTHPRIPLLRRQNERRAESHPRPRPRHPRAGTAVPRGGTTTGALLLMSLLFLCGGILRVRLGHRGEQTRAGTRCCGARKCVPPWSGHRGGCESCDERGIGGCECPFL